MKMNRILYTLMLFIGTAAFGQAYVSTQSHEGKVNFICRPSGRGSAQSR